MIQSATGRFLCLVGLVLLPGRASAQAVMGEAAVAEASEEAVEPEGTEREKSEGSAEPEDRSQEKSAEPVEVTDGANVSEPAAESDEPDPADKTQESPPTKVAVKAENGKKHGGATGFAKEGTLIWLGPAGLTLLSFDGDLFVPMYQWSFGLGGFRAWKSGFAGALALGADHTPIAWGKAGHLFHIEPEIRLGYARRRWFVYSVFSPGLAVLRLDLGVFGVIGSASKSTMMGFSGRVGAGVMGLVWKGLMLGVDFVGGVDLMRYEQMPDVSTYETVTIPIYPLQFRMLIGHKF